jgi:hypothetical protein
MLNKTRASLTLVLLTVTTLMQGCAAPHASCQGSMQRDNLCRIMAHRMDAHWQPTPGHWQDTKTRVYLNGQYTGVELRKN